MNYFILIRHSTQFLLRVLLREKWRRRLRLYFGDNSYRWLFFLLATAASNRNTFLRDHDEIFVPGVYFTDFSRRFCFPGVPRESSAARFPHEFSIFPFGPLGFRVTADETRGEKEWNVKKTEIQVELSGATRPSLKFCVHLRRSIMQYLSIQKTGNIRWT